MQVLHRPSRGLELAVDSPESVNKLVQRISLNVNWLVFVLLTAITLLLSGCGGSGSDAVVEKKVSAAVDIFWEARTRAIYGPSSALSAKITIQTVPASGTPATVVVNRQSNPAAYSQTYAVPTQVRPGPVQLTVDFYAGADGSGAMTGSATTAAVLTTLGALTNSAGEPLGGILTSGTIFSLEVNSGQTIAPGETKQLTFTARSETGSVMAVSAGSAKWTNAASQHIGVNDSGLALGYYLGSDSMTVTVDNLTSPAVPVAVVLPAQGNLLIVDQETTKMVYNPADGKLYATTPANALSRPNSVVVIDPATGQIVNSVAVGSEPKELAVSTDGSTLYVGLDGSNSIRPIALSTLTPGTAFALGGGSFSSYVARAIEPIPGSPNSIVVSLQEPGISAPSGVVIFDSGIARPNRITSFPDAAGSFAFGTSPSTLYGVSQYGGCIYSVEADGITKSSTTIDLQGSFEISATGSLIFGTNNRVFDRSDLTVLGTLPVEISGLQWVATNAAETNAYMVTTSSGVLSFSVATLSGFTIVKSVDLPIRDTIAARGASFGTAGLAIAYSDNTGGKVVIVKDVLANP